MYFNFVYFNEIMILLSIMLAFLNMYGKFTPISNFLVSSITNCAIQLSLSSRFLLMSALFYNNKNTRNNVLPALDNMIKLISFDYVNRYEHIQYLKNSKYLYILPEVFSKIKIKMLLEPVEYNEVMHKSPFILNKKNFSRKFFVLSLLNIFYQPLSYIKHLDIDHKIYNNLSDLLCLTEKNNICINIITLDENKYYEEEKLFRANMYKILNIKNKETLDDYQKILCSISHRKNFSYDRVRYDFFIISYLDIISKYMKHYNMMFKQKDILKILHSMSPIFNNVIRNKNDKNIILSNFNDVQKIINNKIITSRA